MLELQKRFLLDATSERHGALLPFPVREYPRRVVAGHALHPREVVPPPHALSFRPRTVRVQELQDGHPPVRKRRLLRVRHLSERLRVEATDVVGAGGRRAGARQTESRGVEEDERLKRRGTLGGEKRK